MKWVWKFLVFDSICNYCSSKRICFVLFWSILFFVSTLIVVFIIWHRYFFAVSISITNYTIEIEWFIWHISIEVIFWQVIKLHKELTAKSCYVSSICSLRTIVYCKTYLFTKAITLTISIPLEQQSSRSIIMCLRSNYLQPQR